MPDDNVIPFRSRRARRRQEEAEHTTALVTAGIMAFVGLATNFVETAMKRREAEKRLIEIHKEQARESGTKLTGNELKAKPYLVGERGGETIVPARVAMQMRYPDIMSVYAGMPVEENDA